MASENRNETGKAKQVEVTLKAEHTHRSVLHPAGAKLNVTERQAKWLKKLGKA